MLKKINHRGTEKEPLGPLKGREDKTAFSPQRTQRAQRRRRTLCNILSVFYRWQEKKKCFFHHRGTESTEKERI